MTLKEPIDFSKSAFATTVFLGYAKDDDVVLMGNGGIYVRAWNILV